MRPLLLVALLVPLAATAAQDPYGRVKPLVDELGGRELSKEEAKAMKAADRCVASDQNWERAYENRDPMTTLYDLLNSAVVCWQGAAKKGENAGESFAGPTSWIIARRDYVETYRDFIWAMQAKLAGEDKSRVCKRFSTARTSAGEAVASVTRAAATLTTDGAQALAAAQKGMSEAMAGSVDDEWSKQKCS